MQEKRWRKEKIMEHNHINPYTGLEEQMSCQEKLLYSLIVSLIFNVIFILFIVFNLQIK